MQPVACQAQEWALALPLLAKSPASKASTCAIAVLSVHLRVYHLCTLLQVNSPDDKPAAKDVLEMRRELFSKLGWAHWERQEARRIAEAFPSAYPLF